MKSLLFFPFLLLFSIYSFHGQQERTKKPFIEFKKTILSFDTVKAGIVVKGEFAFKNTGDEPLIITTVQAADGGTIADWPKEQVLPGGSGLIKVQLITVARKGVQDKLFTVISNAENDPVILHWRGYIIGNSSTTAQKQ